MKPELVDFEINVSRLTSVGSILLAAFVLSFCPVVSQELNSSQSKCPFSVPCHIKRSDKQKVLATLECNISCGEAASIAKWIVYAPEPPELDRQSALSSRLLLLGSAVEAERIQELSPMRRHLLRIYLPLEEKKYWHNFPVKAEYQLLLKKTELVPGADGEEAVRVPALSAIRLAKGERQQNLMPTYSLDFKSQPFQNFLDKQVLTRHKSENELDFAWRVYVFLRSKYRYFWSADLDRRNSKTCLLDATDCGGLSYLFCGILRSQGVPARPLIGRWARSTRKFEDASGAFNCHVKTEFFADGIGWIPVDVSEAVSHPQEDSKEYFGRDAGDFIVMHLNPDLVLDSVFEGKKQIRSMPDFRYWFFDRGQGKVPLRQIFWKVSNLPARN